MEEVGFYSDKVIRLLEELRINVFDIIRVRRVDGLEVEGLLLPRPQYGDPDVLIIKLKNGYNIGVSVDQIEYIKKIGTHLHKPSPRKIIHKPVTEKRVFIVGTGGTIASRIDYMTGAVYPKFSPEDIYELIPEIREIATIETIQLYNIFSEDMTPENWSKIAELVAELLQSDIEGVVIAHGTDTMGYTAAALSFALCNLNSPVILVGAQRSSDRPSTDTALNLISSLVVATKAPFAEVVITMHASVEDNYAVVHRGTRARKMHTSRRDAFRSINSPPLAIVKDRELKLLVDEYKPRGGEGPLLINKFDDKVALIKFYPGMDPELIDILVDKGYHGIVIEGTGLGHVRGPLVKSIERGVEEGIAVVMASQCIWGRVNLNVYRRGVELLRAGVIPVGDMLAETAFVKLMWVLAQTRDLKEVRKKMLTCYAYEISERSLYEYYPPVLHFAP
ncbi:MAG: Glu-tRNA(Gln) amidotransferase GatDE subunit D [Thermoprotei archaeon]|nr:MAG: Glu-tRNA(Gln) amidotransferase GatDE subunit D [Thermoprotei archaeon]